MSSIVILCSNCGQQLLVPPETRGKQVKCPQCKIVFAAPTLPATASEALAQRRQEQAAVDPHARTPRRWDEGPENRAARPRRRYRDEDLEDEPDRPDRAWYGRYEDDDEEFERTRRQGRSDMELAEEAVVGPAVCLMIWGSLFVLAGVIFLVKALERHGAGDLGSAFWSVLAVVVIGWGSFIILGGAMMRSMKSYGLAMTAAVMVMLFHPCMVIHLILGGWALVVLSKPEVKRAFLWKAEQ